MGWGGDEWADMACSHGVFRPAGRQMGNNHTTEHLTQPERLRWRRGREGERAVAQQECVPEHLSLGWGEPGVRDSHHQRTFS